MNCVSVCVHKIVCPHRAREMMNHCTLTVCPCVSIKLCPHRAGEMIKHCTLIVCPCTYVGQVQAVVHVFRDVALQVGIEACGGREKMQTHCQQLPTMLQTLPAQSVCADICQRYCHTSFRRKKGAQSVCVQTFVNSTVTHLSEGKKKKKAAQSVVCRH